MTDHALGDVARPLRVAVIGSGPSAFYAVDALQRVGGLTVRTDVFDRLPTPFGLVRGGVAPDHQKIKSVVRVYEQIAAHPSFRFFGHVTVGRDLTVADLMQCYDCVIYAVGAESDRRLGVVGEDLLGVHSATAFVGWYNGHPDHRDHRFDLTSGRRAAVVGNGNVAMDVVRVLAQKPERLQSTDIADHALESLRQSTVREVYVLGRRGPAQAAFSPKEIEEIGHLEGVDLVVDPADMELDPVSAAHLETAGKSAQRSVRFLTEQSAKGHGANERKVWLRFCASPVELVGTDGRLSAVRVERMRLMADAGGPVKAVGTGEIDTIPVDLLFKAVGYRGQPLPGVPFDERSATIPNQEGRVLDPATNTLVPRSYVVGWAKRGPTGLIGTNSPDSKETVASLIRDLTGVRAQALPADDAECIPNLLRARGVEFVDYDDWRRLDAHEIAQGAKVGRPRVKLTTTADMLRVVRELRQR